jgi:HK97 family phage portal protein
MQSVVASLLNRSPVPYRSSRENLFTATNDSSSNMEQALGAMGAQSTLFAIVDRISSTVGAATWRLYRKNVRTGLKEDRTLVRTHPALTVWNKPNAFFTQAEFLETCQQHYELCGEYWWAVSRSQVLDGGGPPVELWPIRPDRMAPVPSATDFIAGYTYTLGQEVVPLRTDQVVFGKRPNPVDVYRGISPIGSLLLDIEGERAASAFNTSFFRQGAEPGGIIEVENRLSDAEFEEMVARWQAQHRGLANAHRVAVLEQGKWVDRRYTARDMQFEQLRRFSRETFRQAYAFPKPLLGDVEDVNRSNAEAAEVVFARWLINPRLEKIRESLNDDFLPMFGAAADTLEFDYDDIVPPNAAEERASMRARALSVAGFVDRGYDPAEVLEQFGFNPMTWTGPPEKVFELENVDDDEVDDA